MVESSTLEGTLILVSQSRELEIAYSITRKKFNILSFSTSRMVLGKLNK